MLGTDTKRCINSARRAELSHCDGQSCQAPEPLAVSRKPMAISVALVYDLYGLSEEEIRAMEVL